MHATSSVLLVAPLHPNSSFFPYTTLFRSPVAINQGSSCTATVSDTDAGTKSFPQGTATFTRTDSGRLDARTRVPAQAGTPCTSCCSDTYTPSAAGDSTIQASYGGSSIHAT